MWKSEFMQNYYRISFSPTVPPFAARISRVVADGGTWRLKRGRLKAGESNGKLTPRTCPGCSVPDPYRSYDWALVPAKSGLQGWILMNECAIKVSFLYSSSIPFSRNRQKYPNRNVHKPIDRSSCTTCGIKNPNTDKPNVINAIPIVS